MLRLAVALLLAAGAAAQPFQAGSCGPAGFQIGGSSTVEPVANSWAQTYAILCPSIQAPAIIGHDGSAIAANQISVQGGGSSTGARLVCQTFDIGDMSRQWRIGNEVSTTNFYIYSCIRDGFDTSREVIQVDVAIDGLSVVVSKGGTADLCFGGPTASATALEGLTIPQLRWIYSNFSVPQMEASEEGEDFVISEVLAAGTPGADPEDKLFSTINSACPSTEINIAGADDLSGTQEYFREQVIPDEDNFEYFDEVGRSLGYFNSAVDEEISATVEGDGATVGYFGFAFFVSEQEKLSALPIRNGAGDFIAPSSETVGDGTYNPLARRIFMNLWTGALENTRPFLEFGYADQGDAGVLSVGYNTIPDAEQLQMKSRIGSFDGIDISAIDCGNAGEALIAGVPQARSIINVWNLHYSDNCPNSDFAISGAGPGVLFRRVCAAGGGAPTSIAVSTTPMPASVAAGPDADFVYSCNDSPRNVLEIEIAQGPVYAYAHNAPAVLQVTRRLLRFGLGESGRKLTTALGLATLTPATADTMLARLPEPTGGPVFCFDGESTVDVMDQGAVAMKDLSIGDKVMVAGGKYSEVYSFGHYEQEVEGTYLSLDAGLEKPLVITPDHMVFVENHAVPASMVSVGDKLSLVDGVATVKKIKTVKRQGAFAPFTKEGTIVVNGVVSSSYVSLQEDSDKLVIGGVPTFGMQYIGHVFNAPHRLVCALNSSFCASETYNKGLSVWIEFPLRACMWMLDQNTAVMMMAFLPAFAFVNICAVVEALLASPVLLLAAVVAGFAYLRSNKKVSA